MVHELMEDRRTFIRVATVIFALVALLHLSRILLGGGVAVYTWEVPFWVSWVAILVSGYLAYAGYKLQR